MIVYWIIIYLQVKKYFFETIYAETRLNNRGEKKFTNHRGSSLSKSVVYPTGIMKRRIMKRHEGMTITLFFIKISLSLSLSLSLSVSLSQSLSLSLSLSLLLSQGYEVDCKCERMGH